MGLDLVLRGHKVPLLYPTRRIKIESLISYCEFHEGSRATRENASIGPNAARHSTASTNRANPLMWRANL